MFTKTSRYLKLPDVVTIDAKGRRLKSKSLRLMPEVYGVLYHAVEEIDRLDHLAFKYYKQSRKWWRICDSNPEFISPRALLGKDPLLTAYFPIEREGPTPDWDKLLCELYKNAGIKEARMGSPGQPFQDTEIIKDNLLFAISTESLPDLTSGVLMQELSSGLRESFKNAGISISSEVKVSNEDDEWQIMDRKNRKVYTFSLEGGVINVYENILSYKWIVTVTYNEMNISLQDIANLISSADIGFSIGRPENISRVGKKISIPTDVVI